MQNFIHNLKQNTKFRYIMLTSFILTIFLLMFINSSNGDELLPHEEQLLNDSKDSKDSSYSSYSYACIIDAGSTGSRIHVYRYTKSLNTALISVDIVNEKYMKFKPGLSSFEDNPNDIIRMGNYFEPILNFGRDYVPYSKRTATPLFVLASAGMRKVRDRNPKVAKQIIDITYKYLHESSEFIIFGEGIKIIEGRYEGLWGWIAANYLNGELSHLLNLDSTILYSSQTTKGVLEMGGESLQITFIPQEAQLISLQKSNIPHHIERVNIGDVEFQLFTYSWMGIGMEAAQNRFDTYLATTIKEREQSPCYIKGDIKERQHGIGQTIKWKGNGNFIKCYNGLISMISDRLKSKCSVPKIEIKDMICTPNSILMPKIDLDLVSINEFYYIENFYYTAKVLGLDGLHGKEFLNKLEEKGNYYCSLDVDTAKKEFSKASEDEIKKTCFCAAWLLAILKKGFNLENFNHFSVIRNIENNEIEGEGAIDWALGYLIAEVSNMDMEINEEQTFTFRFLLIMMVILLMIYCLGIKNNQQYPWIYINAIVSNSGGNIKKENNKYAYQRLNVRRTV
eukprot:426543_1